MFNRMLPFIIAALGMLGIHFLRMGL